MIDALLPPFTLHFPWHKKTVSFHKKGALGVWKFYKMGLSWQVVKIHLMMPLCTWHNILKGYYEKKWEDGVYSAEIDRIVYNSSKWNFASYYVKWFKKLTFSGQLFIFLFVVRGISTNTTTNFTTLRQTDASLFLFLRKIKFCNIFATWENWQFQLYTTLANPKKSHFEFLCFTPNPKLVSSLCI